MALRRGAVSFLSRPKISKFTVPSRINSRIWTLHGAALQEMHHSSNSRHADKQFLSAKRSFHGGGSSDGFHHVPSQGWQVLAGATATVIGSFGLVLYLRSQYSECAEAKTKKPYGWWLKYGKPVEGLPLYRQAEVAKHNSPQTGIWVTYHEGVYDITDFVASHPGGKQKIILASGAGLEPFWDMYSIHKTEEVMDMLEELRIGNLHPDDLVKVEHKESNDPYANDPKRSPVLHVNSAKPFNAEPPLTILADSYKTPNDFFFVRNHLPVPEIDAKKHKLEISGVGIRRPISFTIDELKKKFKLHTISATLQCAGNRRTEMAKTKPVKGLSWEGSAISNAEWTGVRLVDILNYVGAKEEDASHVLFQGADKDMDSSYFEASVPAESAFDPRKEVMVVFLMNGKPLPPDHGYPLRVVIPGIVGARQVKWLTKIILSKEESSSHWQQNDYKSFHPSIDWHNIDFSQSKPIQEYPIQSAICDPPEGLVLDDNEEVTIKGYAWSGGGRGIIRVDISIDGGKTWQLAELRKTPQKMHQEWAWTLWEATVPIPEKFKGKQLEIICKAIDTSHNAQPETAEGIWNVRGLIHNAWHRVKVEVPKDD